MENRWQDKDAAEFLARIKNPDLALRVYTTRLLGQNLKLVLHGGGNTSVKTQMPDLLGNLVDVLCVKGSGWDMGKIEPQGLPAVRLEPLRALAALPALADEEMVNVQRCNLMDANAPNPSVETLLHAFLPHKFIDHTHANAIVALTDQPYGAEICKDLFGDDLPLVPYIMPGFALAKKAFEVFKANPQAKGLILLKHGIFTFGATAQEAYGRMIDYVTKAEKRLDQGKKTQVFIPSLKIPAQIASLAEVAPILRGIVSEVVDATDHLYKRQILDFRSSPEILAYVNGAELMRYGQAGTVTPDHAIRTKAKPLVVPAPVAGDLAGFKQAAKAALDKYVAEYQDYYRRNNEVALVKRKPIDPMPRVILVPGLGGFGLGASLKDAKIAGDLLEATVEVITAVEGIGAFESIPEADMFDIEYWPLEQAKLGKAVEKPLARQVAVVTGGGSGIGAATAKAFAKAGAEVAVLDRNLEAAQEVAKELGGLAVACDVTSQESVNAAFAKICEVYGGVDILVSNAGAAWQGKIGEVDEKVIRESFELNFFSHQKVSQAAVKIMKTQGMGGSLLYNTSKQAINPGPDFGPYGLPKAALLFLSRQYAVDHGKDGIRSNAVNADRIRSGLLTGDMIASRSKARGLSEKEYMSGNLLSVEVSAEDVAQCFLDLALARKTTGAVLTVDGGNIAAALR